MMKVFFLLLIFAAGAVRADEMLEKTFTGQSKNANLVEARKEIQDQVYQQVVEELGKQYLGEEKFQRSRALLMSKVSRSSGKFIPFQKPGQIQQTADGFSMSINMKVNATAFRQVLQQNGLLAENDSAPILIPFISLVDKVNLRSDRWWLSTETSSLPLRSVGRQIEGALRGAFGKSGFYVLRPIADSLAPSVPRALRIEKQTPEDLQLMADWFGVPLVIDGSVQISKSEINKNAFHLEIRLSVVQVSNQRPIADVSRSYDTEEGSFETVVDRKLRDVVDSFAADLASQVNEAWQKGSLGSAQVRLAVQSKLTLPEIEQFKEKIRSSSVGIRSIRERLITSQSVVFEVDSPISSTDLAERLKSFSFNGRKAETRSASDTEVQMTLK